MIALSAKKRSELRAEAHKLIPVVIVGDKGLTDSVLAEIDRSLKAHELIKIRAATDDRKARDEWLATICERLQAHEVQQIGKVFVIYRENPKEEKAQGARGKEKPKASPAALRLAPDASKRTSRPRSRTPSPRPESEPRRRRPRTSR